MRVEGLVFAGTAVFFAVVATVYWFSSYEQAGATLLAATALLAAIPGIHLLRASEGVPPPPEDRDDAGIADGAGALGAFPPASIWPVALAGGAVLAAVGLVFGVWFAIPGALAMITAATGAVLESRRGGGATP